MNTLNPIFYLAASLAEAGQVMFAEELLAPYASEIDLLADGGRVGMYPINVVRVVVSAELNEYTYNNSYKTDAEEEALYLDLLDSQIRRGA